MDAKKLQNEEEEEAGTTESITPRSASSVQPTSLILNSNKSSGGAKSWPGTKKTTTTTVKEGSNGISLNLNTDMEMEHQQTINATNNNVKGGGEVVKKKENRHPNNYTAMKEIMRRKQLSSSSAQHYSSSKKQPLDVDIHIMPSDEMKCNDNQQQQQLVADARAAMDHVLNNNPNNNNINNFGDYSLSLDGKESTEASSSWAMLGNHLNETTMDNEEDSSDLNMMLLGSSDMMITPVALKRRQHAQQMTMQNESPLGLGGDGGASGVSGVSGVLSFLGDSPLFDQTIDDEEEEEENEVERNLCKSAEKVKRLEEHLLRNAGGGGNGCVDEISPVKPSSSPPANNYDDVVGREKEVTFAIQDGWETPRGGDDTNNGGTTSWKYTYPKSPYVNDDGNNNGSGDTSHDTNLLMTTPNSKKRLGESMEALANPMNESVIVSDDEASSGDGLGSPSPMKGIGSDGSDENNNEFDTSENSEIEIIGMLGSTKGFSTSSSGVTRHGNGKITTPTRASLMERNQTLVKEVRFADQTCVELSERKKFYKNQVGQYKKDLDAANKENTVLRTNYESSLQETAKLKVLVESLQAQKNQADLQVEAYRRHVSDAEKTHRSSLKKMEKTYQSHLENSQEQINILNGRLHDSLAVNTTLQSKLDEVHDKWESKLESNAASKELISSLKERVATGDATASNADATMQAMQGRLADLQKLCDQHKHELQRERNEREMVEHDRDDLQAQCDDLHRQLTEWVQTSDNLGDVFFNEDGSMNMDFVEELKSYTPVKKLCLDRSTTSTDNLPRTPTSNLLARTLRSELKRRESVSEKLDHAKQQVTALEDKISEMKMDHEEVKADNALLVEDMEERDAHIVELQVAMVEKDEQIARLNEEIEVLCQEDDGRVDTSSSTTDDVASQDESQSSQRDTVSVLEEKLDAVEETLEFTDEELTETKARLADTHELLDETAIKLEQSEGDLAVVRDQVLQYKVQVDRLFKELSEKEVEHANLSKFSDFQTSTLEAMKDKLSQSDKVNVELRAQLKSCFHSLVALEKILRTYENLDGVAGKMMAEQSRKVSRLLETMKQFAQEHNVSTDLLESETSIESSVDQSLMDAPVCNKCAFNEHQLDQLRERVDGIKLERDDANEQLQKAHQLLEDYKQELSEQESGHSKETSSLKKQCDDLEVKLLAATSDLQTCQVENKNLSQAASAAENEVSQMRSSNCDLRSENETLRVTVQSFELQLENERSLLRATREESDGYKNNVASAKAAFECVSTESALVKTSLANVEKEAQTLREAVNEKEKDLKSCKESLSSVVQQCDSLKACVAELETRLSVEETSRLSAEKSVEDASNHIAMLEDALKSKESEAERNRNECQELIVQLKQCQNLLAEAETDRVEADSTLSQLENEIKATKSVLFAYEESIINYKDEIRRLENDLHTTIQEKNSRIQMLEQACTSRQTLFSEQLDRTKRERDESNADLSSMIERLQNELQASNKSHEESSESAKRVIRELEEELFEQNQAQQILEEDIASKQARLEEETIKYKSACQELEKAQNEINSLEMDGQRLASKTSDEIEELREERNRLESEKIQLEEEMHFIRADLEEADEQREHLSAQNASLQKKCNIFKDKVKLLNEKNQAWEESYNAQNEDLVQHVREISRLNNQVTDLKRVLLSSQQSAAFMNRNSAPQGEYRRTSHS